MEDGKYVLISGFNIHDNNRGTAALSYGAISFLKEKNLLKNKQKIVNFRIIKNFLKPQNRGRIEEIISTADGDWTHVTFNVFFLEVAFCFLSPRLVKPCTRFLWWLQLMVATVFQIFIVQLHFSVGYMTLTMPCAKVFL